MINPERDRLIDMLLHEELGQQSPPDLTEKILRRATGRTRPLIIALTWSAAAAVIIIGLVGWYASRPEPEPERPLHTLDGRELKRGARVHTSGKEVDLLLGGYCKVAVQRDTVVHIEGTTRREGIFLERGGVDCNVTKDSGAFSVRTAIGTVSVVGTQFQVRVFDEAGDPMASKMFVRVLMGSVLVAGAWGVVQLSGGEEQLFAQEKKKEPNPLEGKKGKVVGTVVGKGENFIEVKGVGEEEARKYFPEWRGGLPAQGGGLDKAILKTFRETKVGSRVEIEWVFHERLRALKVTMLGAAKNKD